MDASKDDLFVRFLMIHQLGTVGWPIIPETDTETVLRDIQNAVARVEERQLSEGRAREVIEVGTIVMGLSLPANNDDAYQLGDLFDGFGAADDRQTQFGPRYIPNSAPHSALRGLTVGASVKGCDGGGWDIATPEVRVLTLGQYLTRSGDLWTVYYRCLPEVHIVFVPCLGGSGEYSSDTMPFEHLLIDVIKYRQIETAQLCATNRGIEPEPIRIVIVYEKISEALGTTDGVGVDGADSVGIPLDVQAICERVPHLHLVRYDRHNRVFVRHPREGHSRGGSAPPTLVARVPTVLPIVNDQTVRRWTTPEFDTTVREAFEKPAIFADVAVSGVSPRRAPAPPVLSEISTVREYRLPFVRRELRYRLHHRCTVADLLRSNICEDLVLVAAASLVGSALSGGALLGLMTDNGNVRLPHTREEWRRYYATVITGDAYRAAACLDYSHEYPVEEQIVSSPIDGNYIVRVHSYGWDFLIEPREFSIVRTRGQLASQKRSVHYSVRDCQFTTPPVLVYIAEQRDIEMCDDDAVAYVRRLRAKLEKTPTMFQNAHIVIIGSSRDCQNITAVMKLARIARYAGITFLIVDATYPFLRSEPPSEVDALGGLFDFIDGCNPRGKCTISRKIPERLRGELPTADPL